MKYDIVYWLYNDTINTSFKEQTHTNERYDFDFDYVSKDRSMGQNDPEEDRRNIEVKIHSKTNQTNRPKSANEVMKKLSTEKILKKKSVSMSNIEEFFLNRRIPLIKPLISEREILKLQLLQQTCKRKRTGTTKESDQVSLKRLDIEADLKHFDGTNLELKEENQKNKTALETPQIPDKTIESKDEDSIRPRYKKQKEINNSMIKSSPVKNKMGSKKNVKDDIVNKSKTSFKKWKKKRIKQETSNKVKIKSPKSQPTSVKSKVKTTLKNKPDAVKSSEKTKHEMKHLTSKNIYEKLSKESLKHKDSLKISSKSSSRKASKQKLEPELLAKDITSKKSSGHSKDLSLHGKKSDKSDKSHPEKSVRLTTSSEKRKEKEQSIKDQDIRDQLGKMKPQSKESLNGIGNGNSEVADVKSKSEIPKSDKNTKAGTNSERVSDVHSKGNRSKITADEKSHKTTAGKSVKFPMMFEHIIHYVLSNPQFVKLGWTLAPSDQAQLQVVTFKTVPSTPLTYCFRERSEDETKYYSKMLEKVAYNFRTDGTGEIFYPCGTPAAKITKQSTGMRLTLYSNPENDPLIRESFCSEVLGIFDTFGNGVLYDMQGRKLLNFNQLEGIFCSPQRKSSYKWQWCDYKILDNHRIKALLKYMAKEQKQAVPTKKVLTRMSLKKMKSVEPEVDEVYEQILAELPYPAPQKTKKKGDNQFWGFKPITLKVNNEMTLRINGQDDVSVSFSTNKIFLRVDLGVKVDPEVVVRIDELSSKCDSTVPCVFDDLLDPSPSLNKLVASRSAKGLGNKHSLK